MFIPHPSPFLKSSCQKRQTTVQQEGILVDARKSKREASFMSARLLGRVALILAVFGAPDLAPAQTYPDRTVQIVVSYPAGSPPDVVARIVSGAMQESFKQSVVVENKSGGGGNIGAAAVAKAVPDGHTLLVSANGPVAVNKALYETMPYDAERD
jgi:tripartite-type tricarboxylate transporter receptor subunit TctC